MPEDKIEIDEETMEFIRFALKDDLELLELLR